MNSHLRPVDLAMEEDRPEKRVIRNLWLDQVKDIAQENPSSDEPLYLTLPGAEGLDIQLLIENKLISLTEVRSIAEADQGKIVAVESNNQAVLSLQKKFVGLKIKEVDFRSFIHSEGIFSWPEGEDERYCRARVVNLDLNSPLKAEIVEQKIVFPVLEWIGKLCHIHAKPPRLNWTLCLTLHGEVTWSKDVDQFTQKFLRDNLGREPDFDERCRNFFGADLYTKATGAECLHFDQLPREDQQKVIMVLVPKLIAGHVHNAGWRVKTEVNLRYGGGEHAPMVTWIFKFEWEQSAQAEPNDTYREALREIFTGEGAVTNKGEIVKPMN